MSGYGAGLHLEAWIWGPRSSSGVFSQLNTGEYPGEYFLQTGFPRTFPPGPIEVITSCGTTFSENKVSTGYASGVRARASLARQRAASLHESQGPESHARAGARAAVMSLASLVASVVRGAQCILEVLLLRGQQGTSFYVCFTSVSPREAWTEEER